MLWSSNRTRHPTHFGLSPIAVTSATRQNLPYVKPTITAISRTNFLNHGVSRRREVLQYYTAQRTSFTRHVLQNKTDETARISNLVWSLANKATAHSSAHARTRTHRSVKLLSTTKHVHAILATHASTIHGVTDRVRQKQAYTRHNDKRVSNSTTSFRYCTCQIL